MEWLLWQKLEHCKQRIAFGELIEAAGQESVWRGDPRPLAKQRLGR
jgi:hypothetical protein